MMNSRFFILSILLIFLAVPSHAKESQKREMRSVWMATVYNIDWPKTKGTGDSIVAQQKKELTDLLDGFVKANMNSVCFQARPMADAFYKSSYEPWSSYLTGVRGQDPGWDPLAFVVEECHKRGLEINAWVNPYRFSTKDGADCTTALDEALKSSGMMMSNGSGYLAFNPGLEKTRQHLLGVLKEMIQNYNIDGIIFDDYFYPTGLPKDSTAEEYNLWKNSGTTMTLADWRRANINLMVKQVYEMVQATKPYVKFEIGPIGTAGAKSTSAALHNVEPFPYDTDGQFNSRYSDPLAWLEEGTIDYIAPQLYWKTTDENRAFAPMTKWWSYIANHFGRHHYASQSISFLKTSNTEEDWAEIGKQISYNREYNLDNAPGVVFYSAQYINGPTCTGLADYLRENIFTTKSLPPALIWKPKTEYGAPQNLVNNDGVLSWTGVDNPLVRYSVYAVPTGMSIDEAASIKFEGIKSDYLLGTTYTPTFTLPDSLKNGCWYAVCVVDGWNNEFAPACLGAPTEKSAQISLVSPIGGATTTSWNQHFQWTSVDSATYRLQIAKGNQFTALLVDSAYLAVNDIAIDLSNLCPDSTYYWHVQCIQHGKLASWTSTESFVMLPKANAPQTSLVAPDNESIQNGKFTFKCTKVDATKYNLQVAKDMAFCDMIYESTSLKEDGDNMSLDYDFTIGGIGTFYWRVLTDATYSNQTVSDVRSFKVTKIDVGSYEEGYVIKKDVDADGYADQYGMRLTNLWVRSVKSDYDNITFEDDGALSRGFVVVGDTIFVTKRAEASSTASTYLSLYVASTGEHIKDLALGDDASVGYLPCNNAIVDDKGHVLISNLTINVGSTPLKLFQVDTKTGDVTLRATCTMNGLAKPRIDNCGIIGDVETGNFTVMASTSSGTTILRWIFENGKETDSESIALNGFYPTSASSVGASSRVIPVSNDIAYVNGNSIYLTRYNLETGNLDDSFANNTAIKPAASSTNGGCVFNLGGRNYMLYSSGNYAATNGFDFKLVENTSDNSYSGYHLMWNMPKQGLGNVNSSASAAPCISTPGKDGVSQMIYLYVPGNGLAAYKLAPATLKGDVNQDGLVDVSDVTALVSMILGSSSSVIATGDVNGDGVVDVSDVTALVALILQ